MRFVDSVSRLGFIGLAAVLIGGASAWAQQEAVTEKSDEAKWYGVFGAGWMDFEGDEYVDDSPAACVYLGYDYNERWTLEAGLLWAPVIDRSDEVDPLASWDSTHGVGMSLDGLFHFTRWERVDPYLAAGIGYVHYGEQPERDSDQDQVQLRGGGGLFYHFNDEWGIRADFRTMLVGFGDNPNANSVASAGVVWYWGARVPERPEAYDGSADWDKDGLVNADEVKIGTGMYDPDSDDDGLTDGEEVHTYLTNPLEKDTDMDMLTDGAEVKKYFTDPNKRDTDNGGVMDGHEVLEDVTDPRAGHGGDDLVLYELQMEFDTDKYDIKPRYFRNLDVIGKVLTRNPGSTARIEGHCDRRIGSEKRHNDLLSQNRAKAVLEYLVKTHRIESKRLAAKGFGFDRPKVKNDLRNPAGTQANRRVEVYIRKGPDSEKLILPSGDEAVIQPVRSVEVSAPPAPKPDLKAVDVKVEPAKPEPQKPEDK